MELSNPFEPNMILVNEKFSSKSSQKVTTTKNFKNKKDHHSKTSKKTTTKTPQKTEKPKTSSTHKNKFTRDTSGYTQPPFIKNPEKFKNPPTASKGHFTTSSDSDAANGFYDFSGFKIVVNSKILVDETDENVKFEVNDGEKRATELYATSGFLISPNPSDISLPSFA